MTHKEDYMWMINLASLSRDYVYLALKAVSNLHGHTSCAIAIGLLLLSLGKIPLELSIHPPTH